MSLLIEIIKTDLKNAFENPQIDHLTKMAAINEATKWLAGLNNEKINMVIKKYRDSQKINEENYITSQKKLWENAENIYNHIMTEL